ncbi:DUF3253 domain-containing protein [Qipengyuania spongiae]|uniref:DUF3253 domain-containing protein n=1 Tax=Qipengyuania spongiae TaxID=2909673 RepID=A0ABY5T5K7_9SPHN|nr:DUF3253 domain-containing protein [Qipengyuania spongiae]UVI40591.1 DUF3253 domain-containing protein [Qipengyuania spongiae]
MTSAREAIATLLDRRREDATICPSEVARHLAGSDKDWRARMPQVHEAVDRLFRQRAIRLSWKGTLLEERKGPYRIGRAAP